MDKLNEILLNYADVDEIPDSASFRKDLGLSSFDTACLITEIRTVMGISLEPADFIKCKTVGALKDYLNTK
ncbi:MAG: acyl carrier protein [Clostridia bacterium]|nr:acyl carrier protein [Clostridia bacterium]